MTWNQIYDFVLAYTESLPAARLAASFSSAASSSDLAAGLLWDRLAEIAGAPMPWMAA